MLIDITTWRRETNGREKEIKMNEKERKDFTLFMVSVVVCFGRVALCSLSTF